MLIHRVSVRPLFLEYDFYHWNQPRYKGRTLTRWISIYFSGYSGTSPHATVAEMDAAERAIRTMGTNTIPFLLQWLTEDRNARSTALAVFEILGEEGQPSAPALIRLTKHGNKKVRYYALNCLLVIKPDKRVLVPVLVSLIHDPDGGVRYWAAEQLVRLDSEAAEKAGVFAPEFYEQTINPDKTDSFETNQSVP